MKHRRPRGAEILRRDPQPLARARPPLGPRCALLHHGDAPPALELAVRRALAREVEARVRAGPLLWHEEVVAEQPVGPHRRLRPPGAPPASAPDRRSTSTRAARPATTAPRTRGPSSRRRCGSVTPVAVTPRLPAARLGPAKSTMSPVRPRSSALGRTERAHDGSGALPSSTHGGSGTSARTAAAREEHARNRNRAQPRRPRPRAPRSAPAPHDCGIRSLNVAPRLETLNGDRPAVLLGDLLHDGEAEAGAALLAARDERLEEAVLDLLGDAGAGVREASRRGRAVASLSRVTLIDELAALGRPSPRTRCARGCARRAASCPRRSARCRAPARRSRARRRAARARASSCSRTSSKNFCRYTLRTRTLFSPRANSSTSRCIAPMWSNCFRTSSAYSLALLAVVGRLHQLHVAADDGERRLEVVDDAREQAPDRRQPLLALARLARELEADRRRRVRGDELEERAVLVGEAARPVASCCRARSRPSGASSSPSSGTAMRGLRDGAADALVERGVAARVVRRRRS